MTELVKKFLASASVVAGMSPVFGAPALASGFTVTGTAGTEYFLYEQVENKTVKNNDADLNTILEGNSSAPGGNIELGILDDGTNPIVKLSLQNNDGATATLRNMTDSDWDVEQINGKTVGENWFSGVWAQTNNDDQEELNVYNLFKSSGGFGMIGDPNISYINEIGEDIKVGLAGHYNLADRFRTNPKLAALVVQLEGVQASEVFAYDIDGVTGYGWSYEATKSGLTAADDSFSHNGNYEVTIEGLAGDYLSEPPADAPEPSTVLGLMAIGGLVAATKRKSQK